MNATYQHLFDLISERLRTGGWTVADAMDCGRRLIERWTRQYGAI